MKMVHLHKQQFHIMYILMLVIVRKHGLGIYILIALNLNGDQ